MTLSETGRLLTIIAAKDGRNVTPDLIADWQEALAEYTYELCHDALLDAETRHEHVVLAHIIAAIGRRTNYDQSATEPAAKADGVTSPDNMEAMVLAWNKPEEFAIQARIYRDQLRAAGEPITKFGAMVSAAVFANYPSPLRDRMVQALTRELGR